MASSWWGDMTPILRTEEDVDKHLQVIKTNLLRQQGTIEDLRKSLQDARGEAYKDRELQMMKADYEVMRSDYYRGFPITEKESEKIREWQESHDTEKHNNPKQYHGVSGGGYSYRFYPTAIGTSGVCVCGTCHRRALEEASKSGKFDTDVYNAFMEGAGGEFEFQELG